MCSKSVYLLVTLFFFTLCASSQNCTLDIGGKNSGTIVKVFQLNTEQISKMEELRGMLENEIKGIEEDIQKLFAEHPQSSAEELVVMAEKYRVFQQKIVNASLVGDTKLLSTFNQKQYQRYLDLCKEAFRDPIHIIPKPIEGQDDPK